MQYQPHESPEPQWSLPNRAILLFLPVAPFSSEKLCARIALERRLPPRWTWSLPGLSCLVMTSERISSRAGDHRLDEPRQIIPQHGCLPQRPLLLLFSHTLSVINEGTLSPFPAEAGHGLLIQTSVGTAACFGGWRTKRSG